LLPNGKVLVAGGYNTNSGALSSAELFNPATGTWTNTGSMTNARVGHTAILLSNGKVLVAGGGGAELYDPATETWTVTGAMTTNRARHTATLLPNGRVLVAGGLNVSTYLTSSELYDPVMGIWSATGSMTNERAYHKATLLPSGKVLVMGGIGISTRPGLNILASAEIYDPDTGKWILAGAMTTNRAYHTATLLPNGRVLVAGGVNMGVINNINYLFSTELYDVGLGFSNSWQPRITSLTSPLNLGGNLVVTGSQFRGISGGSGGNSQDSSADYPLVQLRSIESGQTVFLLTTNWSTNSFTSLPVWNFPPGYALATVFVNGIQSTSSVVNISVPVPTVATLASPQKLTNGFQFAFTNSVGALFGVLATTNLSLPLTNWTALGGVTEISPGQFQFTDPQAMNNLQRFYRAYSP
jgi:N-acetylneuraminic acid mutarotase